MSDYVMKLQQAMKQQSQDLRDELEDLKTWQSQVKDKSAAVTKKHENHKKSEIFNAAAGANIPPIRYTSAADAASSSTSSTKNGVANAAVPGSSSKKILDLVTECKDRGNAYFGRQQFDDAARAYTQGLDADPTSPLCSTLYANRALCNLKLQKWEQAEKDATSSIQMNRTNAKSFYRRALARKQLGNLVDAKADLDTVQVLVPGDNDSAKELLVVNKMIVERAKSENKTFVSSTSTTSSSSPNTKTKKKLVIQEVSDEDDDDEQVKPSSSDKKTDDDEHTTSPAEQKAKDDLLRQQMKEAEQRQANEKREKAAKEEAAKQRQRKSHSRVEVVVDDDEDDGESTEVAAPKIQVHSQQQQQQQQRAAAAQHQDPHTTVTARTSVSPQPSHASSETSAKPAPKSVSAARSFNVQVFTRENMPTPENFADFERIYREVFRTPELMSALAENIVSARSDPAQIAQLFGANLTNEMLSSFLKVAAETLADSAMVGKLLKGLSQVRRIDDLVMFMESSDKKFLKAALGRSNLSVAEQAQVEKKFS